MTHLQIVAQGIVIGLSIAAPVGPIGLLCIRRSLAHGMQLGLATGLGAATADGIYGAVAGLGLNSISQWLVSQSRILGIAGGLYLFYIAIKTLRSSSTPSSPTGDSRGGLWSAFFSTVVLTLTNPMTILAFVALFAGLGINVAGEKGSAWIFILGVFGGSALWWLFLSSSVGFFRGRLGPKLFRMINIVSGLVLSAFAVVAIWRGVAN